MVITRINPMSCAKVSGAVYALLGLLVGAGVTLVMTTIGSMSQDEVPAGAFFGALFGAGAIVVLPIFYGVLGFVGGAVGALVYNVVAGFTGGIELDVR